MPAVGVSVFDRSSVLFSQVSGIADLTTGRAARHDDWWDLASVTKVLVTLPEALERLELDQPLGSLWARARGQPIGAATVRQLLAHNAGLPAVVPFYLRSTSREEVVANALAIPLEREPGGEAVYSDIGFLLLGELIQELTGKTLSDLARNRSGLKYGPLRSSTVATEDCPWRGRLIVGEVHDENASVMGGVAGHAGAFGTLDLVTDAARGWLRDDVHPSAKRCWATNSGGEQFGLGWWLPPTRGIGGANPGPNSYGCSGFVGNRIWLEPDRGYGVVILSNRVHPVRGDRGPFTAWCSKVFKAAMTLADV